MQLDETYDRICFCHVFTSINTLFSLVICFTVFFIFGNTLVIYCLEFFGRLPNKISTEFS